jgi:hypothetical protein
MLPLQHRVARAEPAQKTYPADDGGHPTAKPAYLPHIEPGVVTLHPERRQQKTRFRGLNA